jgi:NAD(P)-dependent dehydrogenase (short-subunit alcohol dehydrogenase family)
MATNHYGPFLLTHLLIDLLKKSAPCRIVVVASKTHTCSTWRFLENLNEYQLNPIGFPLGGILYGNSKFANFLMTYSMARKLRPFGITVNCLHPGNYR